MDDKDRYDPQKSDTEDDVDVWPAGVLASHAVGADRGSANAGSLVGGVIGATQAARITEGEEPKEERPTPMTDSPDLYGDDRRRTGDEGVSASQREAEADELNG
jgi:hypothetical protein